MRTFLLLVTLSLFTTISTKAQSFQVGFTGGSSVYLGDMDTPSLADKTQDLNPAYGFFFRQSINGHFNIKLNFIRGTLSAADSISTLDWQIARNLSFKTPYSELGAFLEYDLFDVSSPNATKWWTPFITVGLGYFHFTPTTVLNGDVLELQPVGTEGQGLPGYEDKYATNIMSLPIGGGMKVRLTRLISIQAQMINRITFSDYIDDVSTRFYPAYEDLVQKGASPLQQLLYSRGWEVEGDVGPDVIEAGIRKASPDVKDYVFTGTFSIFLNIGEFNSDAGEGCNTAF